LRGLPPPARLPELRAELGLDAVWSQPLRTLSFGQRRRASILAGMASEPAILMLDEPNSGLDPAGTDDLVRLLHQRRDRGGATLLATNDAELSRALGGTVLRLQDGRIAVG
jgi:ABC-type multidrug transport system ATPase subunit